jgi:DNA repair protein RadC
MATLDHLNATLHDYGTFCEFAHGGISPQRVPVVNYIDEPRHGLGTRAPNLFASKADPRDRCRAIMEQVLAPIAPTEAKRIATILIDEFGSFKGTLAARPSHLERVLQREEAALAQIRAVALAFSHCLKEDVVDMPIQVSIDEVSTFLKFRIGFATVEIFYVLYFNVRGLLIHDAPISHGTLTSCEAHGRSIVQAALDVGAAMIVLAHNHPSGDPTPSEADIKITRRIFEACSHLDIGVFDHLVICRDRFESFRARGLL